MEKIWVNLLNTLNQLLSVYQAMLLLSEEKRQVLVTVRPQELEQITKQEETLVLQASKLEELRKKLVSEIMAAHASKDTEASLDQLKKIANPEVVEQLEIFNREFNEVMEKIVPLNKLNTELIQQALGFINYNINILSETAVGPTYAAKGQSEQQNPKRVVFDAKV